MAQDNGDDGGVGAKTIRRVRNLAIFFLGAGVYAGAGWGMEYAEEFAANSTTYFAVGVAIGAIGLVLFLISKW